MLSLDYDPSLLDYGFGEAGVSDFFAFACRSTWLAVFHSPILSAVVLRWRWLWPQVAWLRCWSLVTCHLSLVTGHKSLF